VQVWAKMILRMQLLKAAGFSMPVAKDTSLRLCPLIAFDRNHRDRAKTNVSCWHETDMPTLLRNVRSQGQSGKHLLTLRFSGFDPQQTSLTDAPVNDYVWGWPSIRKVLGSGHRIMHVSRRARRRRDFATFVARAAAVWPGTALAQLSACKVWRVAYSTRASAAPTKRSTRPQVIE
jgi:hypothetical protein